MKSALSLATLLAASNADFFTDVADSLTAFNNGVALGVTRLRFEDDKDVTETTCWTATQGLNDCIDEWSTSNSPATSLDELQNCSIHLSVVTDDCALDSLSMYINERTKNWSAAIGTFVDVGVTFVVGAVYYAIGNENAYKSNIYYEIYDNLFKNYSAEHLGEMTFKYTAEMFGFRTDGFATKNGTY